MKKLIAILMAVCMMSALTSLSGAVEPDGAEYTAYMAEYETNMAAYEAEYAANIAAYEKIDWSQVEPDILTEDGNHDPDEYAAYMAEYETNMAAYEAEYAANIAAYEKIDWSQVEPHILQDASILRGSDRPTQSTTLPYTASSSAIQSYTYTDYYFMGYSSFFTTFTGNVSTGNMEVSVRLLDMSTATYVETWPLGPASAWSALPHNWNSLNSGHLYCFRIQVDSRTASGSTLAITMGIYG
jgi:hypothetical protein